MIGKKLKTRYNGKMTSIEVIEKHRQIEYKCKAFYCGHDTCEDKEHIRAYNTIELYCLVLSGKNKGKVIAVNILDITDNGTNSK
jgi:hypothetical protein